MRKSLCAAFSAASLLFLSIPAASAAATTSNAGWCTEKQDSGRYYYKHGKHWDCVSPGAFCAKAQYNQYGYSMRHATHSRKYKCTQYPNGTWHWRPVK